MSLVAWIGCIEAITLSCASRAVSSGCSSCTCSMRCRRRVSPRLFSSCLTAAKTSSTSWLALSPMAWIVRRQTVPRWPCARSRYSSSLSVDDDAAVVRLALVGIDHQRGARAERAVGEDLDAADAQPVVAEARAQTERDGVLLQRQRNGLAHAQAQFAALFEDVPGLEGSRARRSRARPVRPARWARGIASRIGCRDFLGGGFRDDVCSPGPSRLRRRCRSARRSGRATISPPGGFGVEALTPASFSASELAQPAWPLLARGTPDDPARRDRGRPWSGMRRPTRFDSSRGR